MLNAAGFEDGKSEEEAAVEILTAEITRVKKKKKHTPFPLLLTLYLKLC